MSLPPPGSRFDQPASFTGGGLGDPPVGMHGQAAVVKDHDPVVAVVYELLKRGMTTRALRQIMDLVSSKQAVVETARDAELLDEARELCRLLPWYAGA